MFNKTNTIKINKTEDGGVKTGIFNQFVSPVSSSGENKPKRDYVKSFLITLLIIVVVLGITAFIYAELLKKQVETKRQQLNYYDTTPQLEQLETNLPEMRNLSQRLKLVNSVYDGKLYISSMLFTIIESLTESGIDSYIYFNSFGFRKSLENNMGTVALSGVATNYPALYRQMNNFRNSPHIHDLKMNNLALDEFGNVVFSVSFDINISTSAYIQYINNSFGAPVTTDPVSSGPLFQRDAGVNQTLDNESSTTTATTTDKTTNNTTMEDGVPPSVTSQTNINN